MWGGGRRRVVPSVDVDLLAAPARGQSPAHCIFEVVRQLIVETGAVKGRNRRALDSTVLDDAAARQDTVTQLIAAIRRVARECPAPPRSSRTRCTGHDYA